MPQSIHGANLTYKHAHTHTHCRFTALCPGLPGWASTRRGVGKIKRGKCATIWLDVAPSDHRFPLLHHPPVLCRMPFLPQPSQFVLVWDRHQICWIAYLEAWFGLLSDMEKMPLLSLIHISEPTRPY